MRLFNVELIRFWSRRITWVTMAVVAACMLFGVGIAFTQTSADEPTGAGPRQTTNPDCVADLTAARDSGDDPELAGLSDEEIADRFCTFFEDSDDRRFFATDILGFGQVEDWSDSRESESQRGTIRVEGVQYEAPNFGLEGILPGIGVFLLIVAVVLGGSYVGAEYRSGTVENLLLWEPRRGRVLVTKNVAGFLSGFTVQTVLLVFFAALLLALAQFRGTFQGVDGRFWLDLVGVIIRAALMAGCFFVLAMAIAGLAKNTTAAVVALLGWFVVSNILIELLVPQVRQFELFSNAGAFIGLGDVGRYVGSDSNRALVLSHGPWLGAVVTAIWALLPAGLALGLFVRRDVT
ncbi:MAG: ABC transporter permease subunit [Actinomycetota bacterium]